MKIVCVSYRDWALKIYDAIAQQTNHTVLIIRRKEEYNEQKIRDFAPDFILYYGWSWIIKEDIINDFNCVMLHPSPLPKYRGGSPIQNQIINGEKKSAVTLFIMDKGIDTGDIVFQEEISFEGHLAEIFDRITDVGTKLTLKMLNEEYILKKQDDSQATIYKRRMPEESEITLDELQNQSGEYLYNKIRMLEDPYPNAFIKTKDGKKLLIKLAELE